MIKMTEEQQRGICSYFKVLVRNSKAALARFSDRIYKCSSDCVADARACLPFAYLFTLPSAVYFDPFVG